MSVKEFLPLGDQLLDATKTRPYKVSKDQFKKNGNGKRRKKFYKKMVNRIRRGMR